MDKDRHMKRKPALLLWLSLFAGMAAFMPITAAADKSFLLQPDLDDLKDGDVMLAPIGRRGAGVRISIQTQGQGTEALHMLGNHGVWKAGVGASEVHLSVVMPW